MTYRVNWISRDLSQPSAFATHSPVRGFIKHSPAIQNLGKKEIVGLKPSSNLAGSAHDQIDRETGIDPGEDLGGFLCS